MSHINEQRLWTTRSVAPRTPRTTSEATSCGFVAFSARARARRRRPSASHSIRVSIFRHHAHIATDRGADRARDATAETLVDMKLMTKRGVSEQLGHFTRRVCASTTSTTMGRDSVRAVNNTCPPSGFRAHTGRRARRVCVGTSCINGGNERNERNDDASRSRAQRLASTPSMTARK